MVRFCIAMALAVATMAPAAAQTPAAAPAAAPAAPPAAVDKSQEIVCKREKETGSLVKARKTCLTRRQWAYVQDMNQEVARQLNDSTMSRPGSQ